MERNKKALLTYVNRAYNMQISKRVRSAVQLGGTKLCREGVLEVRRASNFMTTTLDGAYHAFK